MQPGARLQSAVELLNAVLTSPRPADGVAAAWFRNRRYMGAKDRREIYDRVYGILRRRARLIWWCAWAGWQEPAARLLVLADLAISERRMPEEVAKLSGDNPHALAPLSANERGLMATLHGQPLFHHEMPDWVRGEIPEWIEPTLRDVFGDSLAIEVAAMRDEALVDLRVNTLKADREKAIAALAQEGIAAQSTPLSPLGLRLKGRLALVAQASYREGLIEVQDEGSQLVALLTDARPGMAVVDYCAGAGGKTLALAAQMRNKGRLVACDVLENRMIRGQERLRRAGVHNVHRHLLGTEGHRWVKRNAGCFDRVLVDAPCTGTGTWRRNPDAKWKLSPEDLQRLLIVQYDILTEAARLVKTGGRLVFATCSVLPAENERQVERFLDSHSGFQAVPLETLWPAVSPAPCPCDGPWLRLTPARHGTDGFFTAVLERIA